MKKPEEKPAIDNFNGYYEFLNNDFITWVEYEGLMFPNVNTAFQAARTSNQEIRKKISLIENYQDYLELVSKIPNPENWYAKRYKVMEKLIRDKFKRNKDIANKLASTEDRRLVNCYKSQGENEMYWGAVKTSSDKTSSYKGTNNLGKILQLVRKDIQKLQDSEKWVTFQNLEEDKELFPEIQFSVIKQGKTIEKLELSNRNYFMFGSHPSCHFRLEHPSISKFHAAVFFSQLEVILVDLNSSHGTHVINAADSTKTKMKLETLSKTSLSNGDTVVFGLSSRSYLCKLNFEKVEKALKAKQVEAENKVKRLKQENTKIQSEGLSAQQLKSNIGFKKLEALHVRNISKNYSYSDIKEMFESYGSIERIRMLTQNLKRNKKSDEQSEEVLICYKEKEDVSQILKKVEKSQDPRINRFKVEAIDKFEVEEIINQNKRQRDRENERERSRDNDRNHYKR